MIKTTNVTINEITYKYTVSTLGYYIQRNDGKKFIEAYDLSTASYTYTELTETPKPINVQNTTFDVLYPIGSIYIGTMSVCPLQVLGIGTWELKSKGQVLQGANTETPGTTKTAGLPKLELVMRCDSTSSTTTALKNKYGSDGYTAYTPTNTSGTDECMVNTYTSGATDALKYMDLYDSTGIYGNSTTVQPPAYIVNIWERIS